LTGSEDASTRHKRVNSFNDCLFCKQRYAKSTGDNFWGQHRRAVKVELHGLSVPESVLTAPGQIAVTRIPWATFSRAVLERATGQLAYGVGLSESGLLTGNRSNVDACVSAHHR